VLVIFPSPQGLIGGMSTSIFEVPRFQSLDALCVWFSCARPAHENQTHKVESTMLPQAKGHRRKIEIILLIANIHTSTGEQTP
jgi:hypothetical protein